MAEKLSEFFMKRTEFSQTDTAEVTEIANRLKGYKTHFATCHCTGLPVYTQMKEIMGGQLSYVRSGDEVVGNVDWISSDKSRYKRYFNRQIPRK